MNKTTIIKKLLIYLLNRSTFKKTFKELIILLLFEFAIINSYKSAYTDEIRLNNFAKTEFRQHI